MSPHWHVSVENVAIYGLSAILVIWGLRTVSAVLLKNPGTEMIGKAIGGVVNFA